MSDELSNYVLENFSHAVKGDLATWLMDNPLPALVERKFDGIRVFLFKSGEKLVISSKRGELYTPKSSPKVFTTVPEFVHAPHRMILDGEYVARGGKGLFLFDVLQVDDRDLRPLPLTERKKVLHEILQGNSVEVKPRLAKTFEQITAFKDRLIEQGSEGVIVKNPLSTYGQSNSWLKLKRFDTIDCFVTGYEETQEMKRTGVPRSWFIAVYDDKGERVDLGKVGAAVERVDPKQVTIGSVVEIRFTMVTDDLKLRGPFILRVRHDKVPSECLLSQIT
jgi:ATP-dependent DNA ligase